MQDYLPTEPIHITNFTYVLYSVSTNEDNAEQILCEYIYMYVCNPPCKT